MSKVLTAVNDAARRLGHVRSRLAQARAMHPDIDVAAEDVEADAALLDSIADWCLRYTPLVACDMPDGLLLDISRGCAHLYGGERELIADLSGRLENPASPIRSPLPAPSALPGLPHVMANRQAMPAARNAAFSRHCRSRAAASTGDGREPRLASA